MADVEAPIDPEALVDVEFQYECSSLYTRVAILRPGQAWTATGWVDIPANGVLTAAQVFVPARFSQAGLNRDLWSVVLRVDPTRMDRASVRIYSCDSAGKLTVAREWYRIEVADEGYSVPLTASLLLTGGLGGGNLVIGGMG